MAAKVFEIAFKLGAELTSNFKSAFSEAGGMMKTLGGAAAAIGGVAAFTNIATEVDAMNGALNKLQIQTGATGTDITELQEISKNLFRDNYGESFEDVTAAVANVKQNMSDLDNGEIQRVAGDAMLLSKNFDADINEVTRAANNMMKNFGVESSTAFDLFATGAQRGLNFSGEMFDNVAEYAPLFAEMGYSAEEYFGILERGAQAGVYNLDYVNDVMKEFQIRTKDGSKSTNEAMAMLSKESQNVWKSFLSGKGTVSDVAGTVVGELKNMDDQVLANQIGVSLFGTKWEDLEADAIYAMLGTTNAMKDFEGSMETINKLSFNTTGDAIRGIGRILMTDLAMPISNTVLPHLTTFANFLSDNLPTAIEKTKSIVASVAPVVLGIGGAFLAYQASVKGVELYQKAFNVVQIITPKLIHAQKAAMLAYTFAGGGMRGMLVALASGVKDLNLAFMKNPFIIAAAAITAIGVALYAAYQKSETFRNAVKPLIDSFLNGFSIMKNSVGESLNTIIPLISKGIASLAPIFIELATTVFPLLQTAAQTIFPTILSIAATTLPIIIDLITGVSKIFFEIAQTALPMLASVVQTVLPIVLSIIQMVIPIATAILQTLSTIIQTVIIPAINAILNAVQVVFPYIQTIIQTALTLVSGIIQTAMALISGNWSGAWETIKTTATTIMNNIISFFSGIDLFSVGKKIITGLINGIKSMGGAILDGIMSIVPDSVKEFVSGALGGSGGKGKTEVPGYAVGGIVSSPTLAWVGEGGDTEAVIPWNNSERSKNLWMQTGEALGMFGNTGNNEQNVWTQVGSVANSMNTSGITNGIQVDSVPRVNDINVSEVKPLGTNINNSSNTMPITVNFSPSYQISNAADLESIKQYAERDKEDLVSRLIEIQRNERRLRF